MEYVRAEDETLSGNKSMKSRLFFKARRAASSAASSAAEAFEGDGSSLGYKDLDGSKQKSKLEIAEKELYGGGNGYSNLEGAFFQEERPRSKSGDEVDRRRATSSYASLDDGELKAPTERTFFARASDKVKASFKKDIVDVQPKVFARFSAEPFIDPKAYADLSLKQELPSEPAAIILARAEAEAKRNGNLDSGGLWSLKARLAALERDLEPARAACARAENKRKAQKDALHYFTERRNDLQKKADRLKEIFNAAKQLEKDEDNDRASSRASFGSETEKTKGVVIKSQKQQQKQLPPPHIEQGAPPPPPLRGVV